MVKPLTEVGKQGDLVDVWTAEAEGKRMPQIINLSGRKERQVPDGAIYVGGPVNRGGWHLPATKWANPYKIDRRQKKRDGTRDEVVTKYHARLLERPDLIAALPELRGKDLACWCAPKRCHAEVLLELANA